ncbi:MAG: type II toxin-antitoxin system Phd/YefM family antitoxin [Betaproteobacteria bacterium]|jgi:PHD/YefM family antitoxin component YafN of YafNO toxin-antitoxin module|nr:type II toxin-antitoxin system Phd/YefM family antitoxin [Betaproteobacteria bacterium]NBY34031.1 type II toxin-antitoxin system Phd/YefM family antitoxin [Betaproteobacteria bacterium]
MSLFTYSSREFTRDVSAAKRAAEKGPVFITDRGRPAYALLRIEDYYKLQGQPTESLLEVMNAIPGGEGIEFEAPNLQLQIQPAQLLQAD